ncbi:MAG: DUF502 domain-containing protein [Bacteroidetes bacterium]|nr:MAG: DUF502 domain-containing protein [Bacteroidota bacterium]
MRKNLLVRKLFSYFIRGLLLVAPIFVTIYILVFAFKWVDGLIPIEIPGIGLLIVISSVTLLGYIATNLFSKPAVEFLLNLLEKIPVINVIYKSLKDVVSAFMGGNDKFKKAVFIVLDRVSKVKRIGFVTETDLTRMGADGMVAVYVPDSYGITGNVFIVPESSIEPIDLPVSEVMKFIVSGGISAS